MVEMTCFTYITYTDFVTDHDVSFYMQISPFLPFSSRNKPVLERFQNRRRGNANQRGSNNKTKHFDEKQKLLELVVKFVG